MQTKQTYDVTYILVIILFLFSSNSFAKSDVAIKAGTLGAGIDVSFALSPYLSSRFNLNAFSFEYEGTSEGVDFQVPITMRSYGSMIDIHPFRGTFRISAGLFVNNNSADLTASGEDTIELGGTDYRGTFQLNGKMLFRKMAPYLGIGWSPSPTSKSRWGFSADIGVMFHGTPKLQANASGQAINLSTNVVIDNVLEDSVFLESLDSEVADLQKDIDDYALSRFYPVVSFGLILQF